jgi:excinuclease ABC subunit C
VPSIIHTPREFEDQETLAELLSEKRGSKVEISTPQRGPKRAILELVSRNAKQGFERRFRVLNPSAGEVINAWRETLNLPAPEAGENTVDRIECFDISHTQGSDTVASMVVWEAGRMKKADYRKFIVRRALAEGPGANDDFASMHEVVTRRYRRLKEEGKTMPALVLIDGGLGQLHAAADALEKLGIINQPLASIAKREETIYVLGQEDEPIQLDRFSPILQMTQRIRDEAHRFAITFHRSRRGKSRLRSELLDIPGVGEATVKKLLQRFGSLGNVKDRSVEEMAAVVTRTQAEKIHAKFHDGGRARG